MNLHRIIPILEARKNFFHLRVLIFLRISSRVLTSKLVIIIIILLSAYMNTRKLVRAYLIDVYRYIMLLGSCVRTGIDLERVLGLLLLHAPKYATPEITPRMRRYFYHSQPHSLKIYLYI